MIRQNPKDPLWRLEVASPHSARPGGLVDAQGNKVLVVVDHHPASDFTVHAPDAESAKAFVLQQNPGARIDSCVLVESPVTE